MGCQMQVSAIARSRAMTFSGVKLLLCADTYLPTALAISVRHDLLARISAISVNSAISSVPNCSNSGRIVRRDQPARDPALYRPDAILPATNTGRACWL